MKLFLAFFLAVSAPPSQAAVIAGDIAFTGFNADGDDDFSIVVLADLTNETIYFTDKEPDGLGGLTANEGTIRWDTGSTLISAGTVVTFTDAGNSSSLFASLGTLTNSSGDLNLAGDGDAIFAFQGVDDSTVSNFIAAIQNASGNFGEITGSGLILGATANTFTESGSPDGGEYIGPRSGSVNFSDYLVFLGDPANWTTNTTDGEALLPFDVRSFSVSVIPEPTSPLLLSAFSLFAAISCRRRKGEV